VLVLALVAAAVGVSWGKGTRGTPQVRAAVTPPADVTIDARLLLVAPRQRQHLVGHVEAVGLAGRADAAGREQHVDSASRAEVEDGLPRRQLGDRGRVAAAKRGHVAVSGSSSRSPSP